MIIRDIENPFKPRMFLYNIPYDDGGYSGGYSAYNTFYSDAISKAKE